MEPALEMKLEGAGQTEILAAQRPIEAEIIEAPELDGGPIEGEEEGLIPEV